MVKDVFKLLYYILLKGFRVLIDKFDFEINFYFELKFIYLLGVYLVGVI